MTGQFLRLCHVFLQDKCACASCMYVLMYPPFTIYKHMKSSSIPLRSSIPLLKELGIFVSIIVLSTGLHQSACFLNNTNPHKIREDNQACGVRGRITYEFRKYNIPNVKWFIGMLDGHICRVGLWMDGKWDSGSYWRNKKVGTLKINSQLRGKMIFFLVFFYCNVHYKLQELIKTIQS